MAWIRAQGDPGTIGATAAQLNDLAKTRYATIVAEWKEVGRNPGLAAAQDGLGSYDGAILGSVSSRASLLSGSFPMKAFANGGFENHLAQITRPNGPMRIWSEPETGGEAYIPLGASKRARSLEILKQVSEMFGFGLMKQFADGGIVSSVQNTGSSNAAVTNTFPTRPSNDNGITQNVVINSASPDSAQHIADKVSSELYWRFVNR